MWHYLNIKWIVTQLIIPNLRPSHFSSNVCHLLQIIWCQEVSLRTILFLFLSKGSTKRLLLPVIGWQIRWSDHLEPNLCPSYVFQQGHTVHVQFGPQFRRPLWLLLLWPFELSISFWKSIICSVEFWVLIKKWRIKLKYLRVWYPTTKLLGTINLSTMIRKRHFKWLKLVWKQNEASYWLKRGKGFFYINLKFWRKLSKSS